VRNAHIEAIISNDRGAGGAGCAANVNGESHDTMHGRIGGFSARTEELGRTGQIEGGRMKRTKRDVLADLATDAKDLASLRSKLKALRLLEEAAVAAINKEMDELGKEVVEVDGLVVIKEPGVSTHIDKELLVVAVGAKVVAACQKTTEYVRIKVRRSA
jgi:hypothetical protein